MSNHPWRRRLALLALMGPPLVGAMYGFSASGPREGSASPEERAPAAAAGKAGHVLRADSCAFRPGERRAWTYESATDYHFDLAKLGLPPGSPVPPTRQELEGKLEVEVLRDEGETGAVLLGRFHGLPPALEQELGQFSASFLVRVAPDCALTAFARERGTALPTARAQQAALSQTWWRVPPTQTQDVEASNGIGQYRAVLANGADARGKLVQRRVLQYTREWAPSSSALEVGDNLLIVRYGDGLWFDDINATETVRGGGLIGGVTRLRLSAVTPDVQALASASRVEQQYVWEDLLPRVPRKSTERFEPSEEERRTYAALQGVTLQDAVLRFAAIASVEPNFDQRWRFMATYLEAHPDAVREYAQGLQHPELPADLKALGFMALGKARVPEARTELLAIRTNPNAHAFDRIRSNLALVGRPDVGVDFARELRRSARQTGRPSENLVARNALLALGMMGGLRQGEQEVVDEVTQGVEDALAAARTPEEYGPALAALGNLGAPSALTRVEPLSRHRDYRIRALAPLGIRRLKVQEVQPFIAGWLARETDPDVKQEIYNVLYHQLADEGRVLPEALVLQAVRDLEAQPLLLTRQSLVRLLGPVSAEHPAARAALVAQVKHEVGTGSDLYSLIAQYVPGSELGPELDKLASSQTEAHTP